MRERPTRTHRITTHLGSLMTSGRRKDLPSPSSAAEPSHATRRQNLVSMVVELTVKIERFDEMISGQRLLLEPSTPDLASLDAAQILEASNRIRASAAEIMELALPVLDELRAVSGWNAPS